ncbi:dTDP-4-dehydrorhamnose 3,5-epimerase family protein [Streptomyces sp. NPDC049970]|uniref:dTDP-4-dehydrorhamnose 3,5-epimerase family protein n=1 Tax=Streptomyces sp. NPDC049970 TaxID=3155033 RepID=UPI0034420EB6
MRQLAIPGAWVHTPTAHRDPCGTFHEISRAEAFSRATGRALTLAQANVSVSRRGVLRGIHHVEVPPGQAKYVTCLQGAMLDVAVDLRTGAPTYGGCERSGWTPRTGTRSICQSNSGMPSSRSTTTHHGVLLFSGPCAGAGTWH